jgi:hypothetical protein
MPSIAATTGFLFLCISSTKSPNPVSEDQGVLKTWISTPTGHKHKKGFRRALLLLTQRVLISPKKAQTPWNQEIQATNK